ncbi:hypothetical protein [Alkalimarinus coralli]|uniref:hypothetical protein n=1 Tax=Alkalimarinus coralli TaxID=2935863 RepID=UPI00202BA11A|nr:hypothetical protein [Alkalimarinus coralli]
MNKKITLIACGILSTCLFSMTSVAETIKIGVSEQASENKSINRPQVGMTMEKVKEYFGNPVKISGPTGKPAIYQWKYADFTVYFEGEYVIHSVLHPSKTEKKQNE